MDSLNGFWDLYFENAFDDNKEKVYFNMEERKYS